jgi:hypothetical protein
MRSLVLNHLLKKQRLTSFNLHVGIRGPRHMHLHGNACLSIFCAHRITVANTTYAHTLHTVQHGPHTHTAGWQPVAIL